MTFFPEVFLGPLRVGATSATSDVLYQEPLLFASHYSIVVNVVTWPEDVQTIIDQVRKRYKAHDEVLDLIDTLRGQVPMALSADLARHMAEGLELHNVFTKRRDSYQEHCQVALDRLLQFVDSQRIEIDTTASGRLVRLAELLGFSHSETRLMIHALGYTVLPALQLFTRMFFDQRWSRPLFWQVLIDLRADEMAAALSTHGRLASSGMLVSKDGMPKMAEFWVELLLKTETSFDEALLQPLVRKESPGGASRLPTDDWGILLKLLARKDAGVNVLVHGKPAVDKRGLAWRLIQEAGGIPFALAADIPERDHPAAVMVAQRLLAKYPGKPMLVVEKTQSVLTRVMPEGFFFFGPIDDNEDARPLDERLLAENPVPTIWLANDAKRLHWETVTRFLFHAEALRGTRADRQALVESMISALPVAARYKAELVKLEGLSGQQLASARRLAEMTAGRSRRTFARHLLIAAGRSQKALARRGKDEARLPVTRYSLDYINSAGRFGPSQILQALKRRPCGSLCLYGLPGTGKTQFAEHLALELGKPILIKRASELFDKYLGESEKRIAEAFDQAEEEGAILLLDEADSFLRDRSRSMHSWEVTTVNELLQHMERFDDIFICTTNLYAQVDVAALRRFTFKLEFLPLRLDQRWAMFLNETGLRGKSLAAKRQSEYEERLAFMRDLTAGDFATVKRQCVLMGEDLSPEDWLAQLDLEVRAKRRLTEDNDRLLVA
ncbi:MAG: AAA family ATPase [Rhodocyclaceae bacterium]|nr:MAG: AAA family ATPase [Rhodocyclaceae bacterium]